MALTRAKKIKSKDSHAGKQDILGSSIFSLSKFPVCEVFNKELAVRLLILGKARKLGNRN